MDEVKTKTDDAIAKIDETINQQVPALEDSEWADPPELTEAQERALTAAAQQGAGKVEFDDTSHADDEGEAASDPAAAAAAAAAAAVTAKETVDDDVPTGEEDDQSAADAVEPPVVQEPVFDPSLLSAAGLATAEEAKILFGTPKALENAVRLMDARSVAVAQVAAPAAPMVPAKTEQQMVIPAAEVKPEFKMPEPPEGEEWDEATVALVTGLQKQFADQLAAQQKVIAEQQKQTQAILDERAAIEVRRYVEDFDGFVNALPDEWNDTLGKGSGFELPKDGIAMKARVQLDQTARLLADGRAKQGQPPLPLNDLLARALRVAFPQKQEQAVRKQIEAEVVKRHSLKTARPTVRSGGRPKSSLDAAAATAEQWYAKRGMSALPADEFEYDEI